MHCAVQFYGSVIPALLRGATGAYVLPGVDKWKRPTKPIEVYDIQGGSVRVESSSAPSYKNVVSWKLALLEGTTRFVLGG